MNPNNSEELSSENICAASLDTRSDTTLLALSDDEKQLNTIAWVCPPFFFACGIIMPTYIVTPHVPLFTDTFIMGF